MEVALKKTVLGSAIMEEVKKSESNGDEEGCKEEIILHKNDAIESAKAEMCEVIQENKRLQIQIDQLMNKYRNLQKQFQDIVVVQQEVIIKKSTSTIYTKHPNEEPDFFSLRLGMNNLNEDTKQDDQNEKKRFAFGLHCKFEMPAKEFVESSINLSSTPENSIEEAVKAVTAGETDRGLKTARSGEDDVSQENPAKRARVSVRVRCDAPTMDDGCQWRKYGQKTSKGNPCPRAYYRCTIGTNCPVRKQVQRFVEDMSILISTYEGTHNHPLPNAATSMASTTSAAATMLLSGSSSSSSTSTFNNNNNINGINFHLSDYHHHHHSKYSSISSSCPTITLDLTSTSSSSLLLSSNPKSSSTNLNFSSLDQSNSKMLPLSWSNGVFYDNGNNPSYNMNSLSFRQQPQDNLWKLQKNMMNNNSKQLLQPCLPPDTIAAITSNPSFQSALAAALSSIIGSAGNGNALILGNQVQSEPFPVLSSMIPSSFSNKLPSNSSTSSHPGSFTSLLQSLSYSDSKSNPSSPGDNRGQNL